MRRQILIFLAGLVIAAVLLNPIAVAENESAEVHFVNGLVYYALGFTDMAARELKRATELAPEDIEARIALGAAYQGKDDFDNAITTYQGILDLDDSLTYVHCLLGDAYRAKDNADKARFHYLKAKDDDELIVGPAYGLGTLAEAAGDTELAMKYYQEALAASPDHVGAALQLVGILGGQGNVEEGLDVLIDANRYNPREPELHYMWGLLHIQEANYADALHEFERVLQLDEDHKGAQLELRRVKDLLEDDDEPSNSL
ncbi:MAG: tetratricopeptide repeat protein [Firmicutes bacterium]|nr:tetratricopeptide repeat protein [Bacillota bacterium]